MSTDQHQPGIAELRSRLRALMLRDQARLRRRLDKARRTTDPQQQTGRLRALADEIATAERRVAARRDRMPDVRYPAELPISQRSDEIRDTIGAHQVVIVAGETGSGKTTQLPKICMELGRGVHGLIGHTQPRRIAARTVAQRVADELGSSLGETIGYQVRFTQQASEDTLVKLMTDGILLAEIPHDPLLRRYDTIIIDEAHERSLNVDFLLGYLRQILPRRPDLKVVVTSATIDTERFSAHFDDAPIIEVSGRTYPVEVRYRPLVADDEDDPTDRDQTDDILDAVTELQAEGPGDILVFLSGEQEIRDTANALREADLRDTEVLPLYARLSSAEQQRVFQPHRRRRVVLATNVAETSLTVPGIRYVIDPGTARISRYATRTKVQRLPIERISRASADQRKGRCGRTADGICVRLYSEEDFAARPEFTDPEILRTNLSSVLLRMADLKLGDLADFGFLDPPDQRSINDGIGLLQELGAIETPGKGRARGGAGLHLTPVGRKLARLPIDPRLGRMMLEAEQAGCVQEVIVIVAALSIQDPRERPAERRQAADASHARFADPASDFLSLLNLWEHLRTEQRRRSGNQFRRMCRDEFLHHARIRDWQGLVRQLRDLAEQVGISTDGRMLPTDERFGPIHRSMLTGLLSHIGLRDQAKRDYQGARNTRFSIFPGSALFQAQPEWVMAGELVETSRLWGRQCAWLDAAWVEPLATHLVKRTYSEPHWSRSRGVAMAFERVTLYGLVIVAGRRVNYDRIDPRVARELFIRHALVGGEWETPHAFLAENRRLLQEAEELEQRARRRDLVIDEEARFAFYDERVGAEVVSAAHFDTWWQRVRGSRPDLLTFPAEILMEDDTGDVRPGDYPDEVRHGDHTFALTYQFEPGEGVDGVTVHIPLESLNQVDDDAFDWHIPGLRAELVIALLRSLPKGVRRQVIPIGDTAAAILARGGPEDGPLLTVLERELHALRGVAVPRDAWDRSRIPSHLQLNFRVVDGERTVAEGRDLRPLKREVLPDLRQSLSAAAAHLEREGMHSWDIDTLPGTFRPDDGSVVGYPALVDRGGHVAVKVLDDQAAQARAMRRGTRRLLLLQVSSPTAAVGRSLDNSTKLVLSHNPHGSIGALLADCSDCAVDGLVEANGGPAWDAEGFRRLTKVVAEDLADELRAVIGLVRDTLAASQQASARLRESNAEAHSASLSDARGQLDALIRAGFVAATGRGQLRHLPRYLQALDRRLEKLPADPQRDQAMSVTVEEVRREFLRVAQATPRTAEVDEALREARWMIEELRVSLFAQELGTPYRVSDKRVFKALAQIGP